MKCEPASKLSLVSGNYHEPAEPVVMVMASIDVKIRHVFADTPITEASIGAAPPGNNIAQCMLYYSNVNVLRNDNNVARVKSKRIETSICSIINIKLSKPIFGLPMVTTF